MGKRIVNFILGLGMMGLSVGAFYSNEPASKTDFGRILIIVIFVLGLFSVISGLTSPKKAPVVPVVPAPVIPVVPKVVSVPVGLTCPSCYKPVSAEFAVCPYCATDLKPKCPNCGKDVSHDFKNCPYCGTQLSTK